MTGLTQIQIVNHYSSGHAYSHRSAEIAVGKGDLGAASEWQLLQRKWFQYRARALGLDAACLSTFSFNADDEAHFGGVHYSMEPSDVIGDLGVKNSGE